MNISQGNCCNQHELLAILWVVAGENLENTKWFPRLQVAEQPSAIEPTRPPIHNTFCRNLRMAMIRLSGLVASGGLKVFNTATTTRHGIRVIARSFSDARILAQADVTTPSHGFSNGQNLGSISLKRNGIYLDTRLRIVSLMIKTQASMLKTDEPDAFYRSRGQRTSKQ